MMRMGTKSHTSYIREILDLVSGDVTRFIIFILIIYVTVIMALVVTTEKAREALEVNYSEEKKMSEDFKGKTDRLQGQLAELESAIQTKEEEKQKFEVILTQINGELQNIQKSYQDEVDRKKTLLMTIQQVRQQVASLEADNATLKEKEEQLNVAIAQLQEENQNLKSGTDVKKYIELASKYQTLQRDYTTAKEQLQTLASSKRELLLAQISAIPLESLEINIELSDLKDSNRKEAKIKEIARALGEIGARKTSDKNIDKETQTAIEKHAQGLFNIQASRLITERDRLDKREQELVALNRLVRERRGEIIKGAGPFSFPLYNKDGERKRIAESIQRLIPDIETWDEQNIKEIDEWANSIYKELEQEYNARVEQIRKEKSKVTEVAGSIFEQRRDEYYKKIKLNSTAEVRAAIVKDIAVQIRKSLETKANLDSFNPESKLSINQQAENFYNSIVNAKQNRKEGILGKIGLITPGDVRQGFPGGQIPTSGSKDEAAQRIYEEILGIAGIGEGDSDFDDEIKQAAMKRAGDVYKATIAASSLGEALNVDWIITSEETNTSYGREGHITVENWDLHGQEKTFAFRFGSRESVKESMEQILSQINQQIVWLLYTGVKAGRKIEFKVHSRVIGMLIPQYVEDSIFKTLNKLKEQEKGRVTFDLTTEFHPE